MSLNVFHAPVKLAEGSWDSERERFGQRCIDLIGRYVPNLRDILIGHRFLSPQDLEDEFGLLDANILHLDVTPANMFGLRPLPGWSEYRMPVDGLYLCGSGTWPGGTVTGLPGHNASRQILNDLRQRSAITG
jgi:phytoene dehydrogenase-like protein